MKRAILVLAIAIQSTLLLGPNPLISQDARPRLSDVLRSALGAPVQIAKDKAYVLLPDTNADEHLYMLRKLEVIYSHWPTNLLEREKVTKELAELRNELVRNTEFMKAKDFDERLIEMYKDSIALADRYRDLLADSGAIDREFNRKAIQHTTDASVESAAGGVGLGGGLAIAGVEPVTATVLIGGYAIKQGLAAYQRQQQIDEQKTLALERRATQYLNERSELLAKIQVQAGVMAEKRDWTPQEVGFDQDEKESQQLLTAVGASDYEVLLQRAKVLKRVRPRDPFVYAGSGELCAQQASATFRTGTDDEAVAAREAAVKDYLRAAELIPSGPFHDGLRSEYLLRASENAGMILYHTGKKHQAPIEFANTALALRPRDPDGRIRYALAYALVRNGFHDDAIAVFTDLAPLRGNDGGYHYDFACLLSMAGRADEAMTHLKAAWAKGRRDVRWLKKDRDLSDLRSAMPKELAELTTIKWSWNIEYGYVWNNVIVRNDGEFDLHNVAIKAEWKGAAGRKQSEVFWTDSIRAGQKAQFLGAFDSATRAGAQKDGTTARIGAEQNRGIYRAKPKDVAGKYTGIATLMKQDGSDIKTTAPVELNMQDVGEGNVRFRLTGSGTVIEGVSRNFGDDAAATSIGAGVDQHIQVFFDGTTAFGWYRSVGDAANKEIRAFWLDKIE